MLLSDLERYGRIIYINGTMSSGMDMERQTIRELAMDSSTQPIIIAISSSGGDVLGGFALMDEMDIIRSISRIKFQGLVQGYAMSMALTILQACDLRVAGAFSMFMAHGSSLGAIGDVTDIKANVQLTDKLHEKIAILYARRSKKSVDEWVSIFQHNSPWFMTAEEALEEGLIDEIIETAELDSGQGTETAH